MIKRIFLILFSLSPMALAPAAQAGWLEIAKVRMPEISASQWEMLRQQQGANLQIVPVDVNLAVNHGVVYAVSIRHGSGYPDIDRSIVRWIATNWRTDNWFRGGDAYVVSLDVDPGRRHVVFRNNDGRVAQTVPLIEPLRANVAEITGY
jgi:hypothetical protein